MIKKTINDYSVSIDDLKKHLGIELDDIDDDGYLTSLIHTATQHITDLINSDIELTTNHCISTNKDNLNGVFFTSPFNSLTALKVDGVTIDVTGVTVTEHYSYFIIEDLEASEKIEVEFITGYNEIPHPLRQSIIIYAADLYDILRNGTVVGVSVASTNVIEALTASYKRKYW